MIDTDYATLASPQPLASPSEVQTSIQSKFPVHVSMMMAVDLFCRGLLRPAARSLLFMCIIIVATATATFSATTSRGSQLEAGSRWIDDTGEQRYDSMPAILVALESGGAGADALQVWSQWAENVVNLSTDVLPNVWVLCSNPTVEASIITTARPHLQPFFVDGETSWATALRKFLSKNGNETAAVGLLGEGALPYFDLAKSAALVRLPLSEATQPIAILTRARSSGATNEERHWLSDKFVSQVWCNRAMLERSRLASAGLENWAVQDLPLLDAIGVLIHSSQEFGTNGQQLLVDGTKVIPSVFSRPSSQPFEVGKYAAWSAPAMTAARDGEMKQAGINIGRLELALVESDIEDGDGDSVDGPTRGVHTGSLYKEGVARDQASETPSDGGSAGKSSKIVRAPWPPEYVLETVAASADPTAVPAATSKGLVLGSNVNCGYLDMATNFWRSVQEATSGTTKVRGREAAFF